MFHGSGIAPSRFLKATFRLPRKQDSTPALLIYCKTILDDSLPVPSSGKLEQAYRIAGTMQFKGRLRDVFMILSDDHSNKSTKSTGGPTNQSQP